MGLFRKLIDALKPRREPTPAGPTPPPAGAAGLVAAINAARAANRRPPLAEDPRLSALAQRWASTCAARDVMAHGDAPGRIAAAFPGVANGEVLAEGQPGPQQAVDSWLASPPHRRIMLGDFRAVGVGAAASGRGTIYWNADFID